MRQRIEGIREVNVGLKMWDKNYFTVKDEDEYLGPEDDALEIAQ